METCKKITVLDHGQKISEGSPNYAKSDPAVIEVYLGREMQDDEVLEALKA